jgi:hypothetical protein
MDRLQATRASYDEVADRYADEIGGELVGNPSIEHSWRPSPSSCWTWLGSSHSSATLVAARVT